MTFYISNGNAKVIIEAETFELTKRQLIEIQADKNGLWKNSESEVLELFVVKTL